MESPKDTFTESEKESRAEGELDRLLTDPEYAFLHQPQNSSRIDDAATAVEALRIAKELIARRHQATVRMLVTSEQGELTDGRESEFVSYEGLLKTIEKLDAHRQEIGVGADAVVVVATNEYYNGKYEICYKFAKEPATPRGRNAMDVEIDLQGEFYRVANTMPENTVKVPRPYFYTEIGSRKYIGMEKLPARSVDDIVRGHASIPSWVTERHIDMFVQDLVELIDVCHEQNLYHRDLHPGNIMFTQSRTETEKLGYIIDFGLSGRQVPGFDPYRKETNTETFTYEDDYGKIAKVKDDLLRILRSRV